MKVSKNSKKKNKRQEERNTVAGKPGTAAQRTLALLQYCAIDNPVNNSLKRSGVKFVRI